MFESLSDRLEAAFTGLRRKGKLSASDVEEGLSQIRLALLEADVSTSVAKTFLDRIRAEAVGEKVLNSLTPTQHLVKIVNDELVTLLGGEARKLNRATGGPTVILLIGLQGSGKTTAAAKLARKLKAGGTKPLLAACDLQRPAAIDQLKQLGEQINVEVIAGEPNGDPVKVAKRAVEHAKSHKYGAVIVDSAGRLAIDDELMQQARDIRDAINPTEVLLVLDAMTGQDAVRTASAFAEKLDPTGSILTKLDGDARGGAALSLVEAAGVPILYAGVGEKIDDLEAFHPDRMAQRILGMGDIMSLIEKAEAQVEEEEAKAVEQKIKEGRFDLGDFLDQLQRIQQMGPLQQLLGMLPNLPGVGRLADHDIDERQIVKVQAVIQSMTPLERKNPSVIDASRRKRIAKGSGTQPQDVNQVLDQFDNMRSMMRQVTGVLPGAGSRKSRKARKGMPKMKGF